MDEMNDILSRNLKALRQVDSALADSIAAAAPAALQWAESKQGPLTATFTDAEGRTIALASKYQPTTEAQKLISMADPGKHACVVVLGMGLGYHVLELLRTFNDAVIIVFEPDIAILRAVLEHMDHSRWLGRQHVVLCGPDVDRAALLGRVERFAGSATQGTILVPHPPTRQRFAEEVGTFTHLIKEVLAFFRTNVATALVNASRTCYNQSCNLPHYVAGSTVNELHNIAKGYPAVCVGAGPSLAKNVDLLRNPAVRRNVIVITAQTTLKPLLDRGIRPDFVTALDYSEISKRFYEGLPPLPDVTLVVEPKGHPAIIDAYPGPVRVTASRFLDTMLGDLARPIVRMKEGATVAHLSFYLAQFLGCDPIMFIGQDLGFSDGLYYCPGTAIHDVWMPELGAFNTLETMEWTRIVRHKNHLKRREDVHGRPIFTDEQMITYLKQFERDFISATQQLIDCTEGGLPKEHTERMTFADALSEFATREVHDLPPAQLNLDHERLQQARTLMRRRIREVEELHDLSEKAIPLLHQMREHQKDQIRFDQLFDKIRRIQNKVHGELMGTFQLVNDLNVVGAFKRARADRAIQHSAGSAMEKQAGQIERDIENIDWLKQACDEALATFHQSLERIERALAAPPGEIPALAITLPELSGDIATRSVEQIIQQMG